MKEKTRVGIFGLTCCAGEELNITNLEEELVDIAEMVDIKNYLMVQSNNELPVDIAFVAGFVATPEDRKRLYEIRENCKYLIALGSCATSCGGIHNMRSRYALEEQYSEVYDNVKLEKEFAPLSEVKPLDYYVDVDYYIRGCPVPEEEILYYIFKFIRNPPVKNELLPVNIQTGNYDEVRGMAFSLDPKKCVVCRRCVNICQKHIGVGAIDIISRGGGARVVVSTFFGDSFENRECILCGQCLTVCPVGAYSVRNDVSQVRDILDDPDNFVIALLDPMACTSMMQHFSREENFHLFLRRVISSLREIGFDKVISFTYAYHLSLIHQARHVLKGDEQEKIATWCPAAINLIRKKYPSLLKFVNMETEPLHMLMSILRNDFGKNAKFVLITPCVAYKNSGEIDAVLTPRELRHLLSSSGVDIDIMAPDKVGFDRECLPSGMMEIMNIYPLGPLAESLLSYIHLFSGSEENIQRVQIEKGVEEIVIRLKNSTKRTLIITEPRKMDKYQESVKDYDYIEIVPCIGGCAGGGGHYPTSSFDVIQERRSMIDEYNNRIVSKLSRWALTRAYENILKEGFRCPL